MAKIVLVANAAWNLWNFRRSLIELLVQEGFTIVCAAPEDGYQEKLRSLKGLRFVPLRRLTRKGLSIWNNLHSFLELLRLLRHERPDLVVCYTVKPNIFGSLAAQVAGIPAIASVEGQGYTATASGLFRFFIFLLYRLAFAFARRVIFLNHDDRREFLQHKAVKAEKTLVITGTGIDTEYFKPAAPEKHGACIFLFIGRLLSDKGIREFVRAAALVKAELPQVRFQILGSTDEGNPASIDAAELQQWVESQHIEYLGYTDDVRPFISGASAIVLPSYREGMPRVLLEGMAMGKPVITTDSVGCRDTVEDGINGFIVPSENAAALSEAMFQFIRLSRAEQIAMSQYSRYKAVKKFSNDRVLPQYLRVIRSALRSEK
ncbi:MAG: glycosyltransferase family 4 protein [Saprospiraceae bacterium]|nr:glycosyltransferase family 4 protein [Saprospiraceae bacterium]